MRTGQRTKLGWAAAPVLALVVALAACGGEPATQLPPGPAGTATPAAQALRLQAEQQHLPRMSPALRDLVQAQRWFSAMTPAGLNLSASVLKAELAARARGESASPRAMLAFAAEQAWYKDGLDEAELRGLGGVFEAYARSLTVEDAPAIGPELASTLSFGLFRLVKLAQAGDTAVVVASRDERLGRRALDLASEYLPRMEGIVGKFPYSFLYLEVATDFPPGLAGLSIDEFILLSHEHVDAATVIHEITHSTVFGLFPTWFEEGLAYFMEAYLTDKLAERAAEAPAQMRRAGAAWLDLRAVRFYTERHYFSELAGGFLLLKGLYEIEGIEGLGATVRALRTRTYNDSELLAAIAQLAPPARQGQVRRLFCERVVGTIRDWCAAG